MSTMCYNILHLYLLEKQDKKSQKHRTKYTDRLKEGVYCEKN